MRCNKKKKGKNYFPIIVIALTIVFLLSPVVFGDSDATEPKIKKIKVPETSKSPVLVEGIFRSGEWDDAKKIVAGKNLELFFKQNSGHLFIGIKCKNLIIPMTDIYISDGEKIYNLHASAQIAERIVKKGSKTEKDNKLIGGYAVDWTANELRWDEKKLEELKKSGKNVFDAFSASIFKYEGFVTENQRIQLLINAIDSIN